MYSFETGVGGAASEATMEVILDSGASHNVVPKEWVKHLEWGPAEGSCWLPHGGWKLASELGNCRGFAEVCRGVFLQGSLQCGFGEACLAQRHSSAEARAHDPLERVESDHLRERRSRQGSDL